MTVRSSCLALLDLLAPRRCVGCDVCLAPSEEGFCGACSPLLEAAPRAFLPPARTAALYLFGGPLADGIRRLKYDRRPDLIRPLGTLMCSVASAYGGRVEEVLPVPLHGRRLRDRGFNQAALLARPLARALGVPLAHHLRRTRPTPPQASLDRRGRAENMRGAFVARGPRPGATVLLVDDVRTTGATMAAAASALRAAGASQVLTLTLATATQG